MPGRPAAYRRRRSKPAPLKAAEARSPFAGIETVADAQRYNNVRSAALRRRLPAIAEALDACAGPDDRCGQIVCAGCSSDFRHNTQRQFLTVADAHFDELDFATVYLDSFEAGQLTHYDLKRGKEAFRKRLTRAGFKGATIVGGIEVAWKPAIRLWVPHTHLLAADTNPSAWAALAAAYGDRKGSVVVQPFKDPERQTSYLLKFATYCRINAKRRNGRGLAVPLPPDRLTELVAWWSNYNFDDFVFLYGAKRRGAKIVLNNEPS
jgi:hypothetical protein